MATVLVRPAAVHGSGVAVSTDEEYQAFFNLLHKVSVVQSCVITATTICGWEHLALLPAEIRAWRLLLAGNFRPPRIAVLLARYAVIGAIVSSGMFFWGDPRDCGAVLDSIWSLYIILWACCASIFLYRLKIMYCDSRRVMFPLVGLWCISIGVWAYIVHHGFHGVRVPDETQVPWGPKCKPNVNRNLAPIGWMISFVFDLVVLVATVARLRRIDQDRLWGHAARTHRWLWTSSLIYFSVATAVNLSCFLAELLVDDSVLSQIPTSIAFVMHVVVASRLVLASKGWIGDYEADDHVYDWELEEPHHSRSSKASTRRSHPSEAPITFDLHIEERVSDFRPQSTHQGPQETRQVHSLPRGLTSFPQRRSIIRRSKSSVAMSAPPAMWCYDGKQTTSPAAPTAGGGTEMTDVNGGGGGDGAAPSWLEEVREASSATAGPVRKMTSTTLRRPSGDNGNKKTLKASAAGGHRPAPLRGVVVSPHHGEEEENVENQEISVDSPLRKHGKVCSDSWRFTTTTPLPPRAQTTTPRGTPLSATSVWLNRLSSPSHPQRPESASPLSTMASSVAEGSVAGSPRRHHQHEYSQHHLRQRQPEQRHARLHHSLSMPFPSSHHEDDIYHPTTAISGAMAARGYRTAHSVRWPTDSRRESQK